MSGRVSVKTDQATLCADARGKQRTSLTIQVITGGVNVFFEFGVQGGHILETNRDGAGNPQNGFFLNNVSPVYILPEFSDVLYCLAGSKAEVYVGMAAADIADAPKARMGVGNNSPLSANPAARGFSSITGGKCR